MKQVLVAGKRVTPSKIVCVGRNYVEHIQELNNEMPTQMVLFNKPNSAISEQLFSFHQEALHYEAELCLLIENGEVSALGVGLDLTKRGLQSELKSKGLPWERAKAFDGSAVFSEFVPIADLQSSIGSSSASHDISAHKELPLELGIKLLINNDLIQQGTIDLMINKPAQILKEITTFTQLSDGDIVMTGTPKGVGKVVSGANFQAQLVLGKNVLVEASWQAQ